MLTFGVSGSKFHLAPLIANYLPEHTCYVEPFGGSGAVLLYKNPSKVEIFNDLDNYITNFMLQLRDNYHALVWKLTFTPWSRELYHKWFEELPHERNPLEKAAKWYYLQMANFAQRSVHIKTGWRHGLTENPARDFAEHVDNLINIAKRLRNVQIENKDAMEVIQIYDSEDTVIYADPPYMDVNIDDYYYLGDRKDFDHEALASLLNNVKSKVILSYYENEKLNELYPNWRKLQINTKTSMGYSKLDKEVNKERTEVLLFNYEPMPLFRKEEECLKVF